MPRLDLYVEFKLQASVKLGDGETRVGRDPGSQVQIPDPKVSRMHAVIQKDGGVYEIENLGVNGTKVNGYLIENPKLLRPYKA